MTMTRASILLVLLLGTMLRFHRIDHQSLWYDEGNSARMTARSPVKIVSAAAADIHPPGYYLALSGWSTLMGRSELSLRSLSALSGVILISLVYVLGRRYFTGHIGLLASLLSALHPALIYYSQEARMYMLAAMLGTALFVLTFQISDVLVARNGLAAAKGPHLSKCLRIMRAGQNRRHRRLSCGYILTAAAGLYTHYTFAFVFLAANIAMLWHNLQHRKNIKGHLTHWVILQTGAVLLFLPWMSIAIEHVTTWPAGREHLPFQETLTELWRWLILGPTLPTSTALPGLAAVALLALIGSLHGHIIPILIWLVIPAGLTATFGLFSESFAKFLLLAVPPCTLITASGMLALWFRPRGTLRTAVSRSSAILMIAPALWFTIMSLNNLYNNPAYFRDDYRAIATDLAAINRSGDAILLHAPNQWEVFTYYYPDSPNVIPIARARPLDQTREISALKSITSNYQRIFVIYWGEDQPDPERVIERWLNENTYKADDRWYGSVRLATYSAPLTANGAKTTVQAQFGDSIVLHGYSLYATTVKPGGILQLTLFWNSTSPITTRHKVFVHVYGNIAAHPVAQHDSEPTGGLRPTTTWTPGEIVVDNHGVILPTNLLPGDYQIEAGMYNLETGLRLETLISDTDKRGSLTLGEITVVGDNQ